MDADMAEWVDAADLKSAGEIREGSSPSIRTKPQLLDLCCGVGGAADGYTQAGFEVTGVDIVYQYEYPYTFIQSDVFELDITWMRGFDFIHASFPCQAFTCLAPIWEEWRNYPNLIKPGRILLQEVGKPWIIENVPQAPIRKDLLLCGSHFRLGAAGDYLKRHRHFEFSFGSTIHQPVCKHRGYTVRMDNRGGHTVSDQRKAMQLERVNLYKGGLTEAIPPAYTKYIGEYLLLGVHSKEFIATL